MIVFSSKRLAHLFRIPSFIIGMTIVSIGTSLPEIFTNLAAGIKQMHGVKEASGIAIGTIIGNCLYQITFIVGICVLFGTLYTDKKTIRDGWIMVLSIIPMLIFSLNGFISRIEGVLLVVIYLVYIIWMVRSERVVGKIRSFEKHSHHKGAAWTYSIMMLVGLLFIWFASNVVVENGINISRDWHLSPTVMGILVGIGTSLPELTTSLKALLSGEPGISLGNLIGSNITDPLLSLGLGASIAGFDVEPSVLIFDIPYWFIAASLIVILAWRAKEFNRRHAIPLILVYLIFVGLKITKYASM